MRFMNSVPNAAATLRPFVFTSSQPIYVARDRAQCRGAFPMTSRIFKMSGLDKRQEGFEKKFALDEEQKFKAEARRNKLLGLWVAEQLGHSGDAAAAYAKEVVAADFEEAGDADVVRKVMGDLAGKNVTEAQVRVKMDELMATAILQVKAGT
jgi:hypothetical protein